MGAVYQAAALSKAFKVKPFVVRDAAVFPIQVSLGLLSLLQGGGVNGAVLGERFRVSCWIPLSKEVTEVSLPI